MGKEPACLCNNCSFGNKKDNCVKCSKFLGGSKNAAYLCGNCSVGSKKDNCAKCDKWMGGSKTVAMKCNNCGPGKCVKCGKSVWLQYELKLILMSLCIIL